MHGVVGGRPRLYHRVMPGLRTILHVIHAFALSVWLAAVLMSGVVAALVFPLMKSLNPTLPEYAAYDGPHSFIVAGQVAARVFLVSDVMQFVMALFSLGSLGAFTLLTDRSEGGKRLAARGLCLTAAIGALGFQLLVLAPRMNKLLGEYWAAAKAGDNTAAAALREAFQELHPTATAVLLVIALAVAACLLLGLMPVGERPTRAGGPSVGGGSGDVPLEEPALARGGS